MITPELRQLRYVVAVAQSGSFTRAAEDLHVAQQALSQQVRLVESQLGLDLFVRSNRGVQTTPAGAVFVQEARRVITAAERAVTRALAAGRGEAGEVRIVYTLTSVWETLPALLDRLHELHPALKARTREAFGADVERLLRDGEHDLALCPRTSIRRDLRRQELRRERFIVALSDKHPLCTGERIDLAVLAGERFELWPRDVSPGFYDAVVAACRAAGFEPKLDEHGTGSTVWGNIARGRGIGLVVGSLTGQLQPGITLVPLAEPIYLTVDLVWHKDSPAAAVHRVREIARAVGAEQRWTASL